MLRNTPARSKRFVSSLLIGLPMLAASLCLSGSARGEGRGEFGVDVHAGISTTPVGGEWRGGVSAWYRLLPPLALGLSGEAMTSDQGEYDYDRIHALEAFADVSLAPHSPVSAFARLSSGVADVNQFSVNVSRKRTFAPIFELNVGPELRFFQRPHSVRPSFTWFVRASGSLTLIPSEIGMLGLLFALGFEA